MTVLVWSGVLLAAAGALALVGPRLLGASSWQVRHPRTALAAWEATLATVSMLALGAVAAAVGTAVAGPAQGGALAGHVAGWSMLLAVSAVLAVIAGGGEHLHDAARADADAMLALPHVDYRLPGRARLRVCAGDGLIACAVPGAEPVVVVSAGVVAALTPAQLRAVVGHEQAHLRGRHDRLRRVADLVVACLPRSAVAGRARRRIGLLVELAADDRAARVAGAVHVANALERWGRADGDAGMLLRAQRLAGRRWEPASRLAPPSALYGILHDVVTGR